MTAGRFKRLVTFQTLPVTADDGTGGQPESWVDMVRVWAEVVPLSAFQALQAGQLQTEITHRVACWYDPQIEAAARALRVRVDGGGLYHIRSVRDVEGRHITLDCDAVKVDE